MVFSIDLLGIVGLEKMLDCMLGACSHKHCLSLVLVFVCPRISFVSMFSFLMVQKVLELLFLLSIVILVFCPDFQRGSVVDRVMTDRLAQFLIETCEQLRLIFDVAIIIIV